MPKSTGTDNARDGETAKNTPSNNDEADKTQANTPDTQPPAPLKAEEAEKKAEELGTAANDRVGQTKEELKTLVAKLQEDTKTLLHKLDDLG